MESAKPESVKLRPDTYGDFYYVLQVFEVNGSGNSEASYVWFEGSDLAVLKNGEARFLELKLEDWAPPRDPDIDKWVAVLYCRHRMSTVFAKVLTMRVDAGPILHALYATDAPASSFVSKVPLVGVAGGVAEVVILKCENQQGSDKGWFFKSLRLCFPLPQQIKVSHAVYSRSLANMQLSNCDDHYFLFFVREYALTGPEIGKEVYATFGWPRAVAIDKNKGFKNRTHVLQLDEPNLQVILFDSREGRKQLAVDVFIRRKPAQDDDFELMARFDLETTPEVKTKLVKMAKEGKRSMTGREEVKLRGSVPATIRYQLQAAEGTNTKWIVNGMSLLLGLPSVKH